MVEETFWSGNGFVLVGLKACSPPTNSEGDNWHRYVITRGGNRIEGYRQGDTEAVTEAVNRMVEQMNERRQGKYGAARAKPSPKPKN